MNYRRFKKIIYNYFRPHSSLKPREFKKSFTFEDKKLCKLWGSYRVSFVFNNKQLVLTYCDYHAVQYWTLTRQNKNRTRSVCNTGTSLEECCDYLWKIKA